MTKFIGLSLVGLLFGLQSLAHTLVVSDIDDTIKISHVLSAEKYYTAADFANHFTGMSALYRAIGQTHPDTEFAYVSNAPSLIMKAPHLAFLTYNHFPEGTLYLREDPLVANHKVSTITRIIQFSHPTQIIMIGDNGEQDGSVYNEIRAKFPQIPSFTYIHQVYSTVSSAEPGKPLLLGQVGFVTAADLALQLQKAGALAKSYVGIFADYLVPIIQKESRFYLSGQSALPDWLNCHDFHEKIETDNRPSLIILQKILAQTCK